MLVQEIMAREVATIDARSSVLEACHQYKQRKVGCLVVVSEDRCVGIVTERDLIERVLCEGRNPQETTVSAVMSSDLVTVHALETYETALARMREFGIKKLPVVVDGRLVGILTITDIAAARPEVTRRFMESWVKPQWKD